VLVTAWLLVLTGGCGLVVGCALVTRLDSDCCFVRAGDRVLLATWLGLLVVTTILLVLSLFGPLSPLVVVSALSVSMGISLVGRQHRRVLRFLGRGFAKDTVVGVLALAGGTAAYCSQVIVWYDSGLYHVQTIKWLSEYGLVPGLAMIHSRFGFISSWFTLPAVFNHGILVARVASLPGALCLWLLVVQASLSTARVARQRCGFHDLFFVAFAGISLPLILVYGVPNSSSPDFPVIVLTGLVAWSMLATARDGRAGSGSGTVLSADLIPLLLAAGATSIKLSALPLLVVAGCFYAFRGKFSPKRTVAAAGVGAAFFLPVAAGGILTSGCAFYPSPFLCFDVPWSLGAQAAAQETSLVTEIARWGGAAPPDATPWNWMLSWVRTEQASLSLLLLSALACASLLVSRLRKAAGAGYVIALGGAGTLFMLVSAPTWRFGLGYLVLLPALAVAHFGAPMLSNLEPDRRVPLAGRFGFLASAAAALIALHVHVVPRPSYRLLDEALAAGTVASVDRPHFNLLLPPRTWNIAYDADRRTGTTVAAENPIIEDRVGDLEYYRPEDLEKSDLCWDAPLPCAKERLTDVLLRERKRGLKGGFQRPETVRQ
jgi:hypothetical protein